MSDLLKTPFHAIHLEAGARMVEFGGWHMPVQYRGILEEHQQTRTKASLFDCSHMGQFRVTGPGAGAALDDLLPRRVGDQEFGTCRYNFLLNETGCVLDDLIVYRIAAEEYYIVVNAGTRPGDAAWFRKHLDGRATFADESDETAKLDLQGPDAVKLVEKMGLGKLPGYFHFLQTRVAGIPMIVSQTGYTGERGFEFYFDAGQARKVWDLLLSLGDVLPAGLGARDTLRLEMGYPLYGHELNTSTTPIEAGFKRMLNLDHNFIGQQALLVEPKRKLVGLQFEGRRAAREHTPIMVGARKIGEVTSGSFSPSLGCAVAMAYVETGSVKPGDAVVADIGRGTIPGKVVKLPFYRNGTAGK